MSPRINTLEIKCDDCKENADVCFCLAHYEEKMDEAFERGRVAGQEEARLKLAEEKEEIIEE